MLTLNICSSSRTTSSLVHFSFVILTTFRTVPTSETNVPHVNKTHEYVSISMGHSIPCTVDEVNPWGKLLSKLIYHHCIHCCLQSSLYTVHLWFHWMAEPTQPQGCSWHGPTLLLHKHTNTHKHVHTASYEFLHIFLSQNWGPSDPKENQLKGLYWQKIISSFLQNSFASTIAP